MLWGTPIISDFFMELMFSTGLLYYYSYYKSTFCRFSTPIKHDISGSTSFFDLQKSTFINVILSDKVTLDPFHEHSSPVTYSRVPHYNADSYTIRPHPIAHTDAVCRVTILDRSQFGDNDFNGNPYRWCMQM